MIKRLLSALLIISFASPNLTADAPKAPVSSWYADLLAYYPEQKKPYADPHNLSLVPAEQHHVALQLFAADHAPSTAHLLLKNSPNKELKLYGDQGILKTDRTQTAVGHAVYVGMLASASKHELPARQSIVRFLAQNSQLRDELHNHLKKFAEAEAVFLKLYQGKLLAAVTSSPEALGASKRLSIIGSFANICGFAVPLPGATIGLGALAAASTWALSRFARRTAPWEFIKTWGGKAFMPYQLHQNWRRAEAAIQTPDTTPEAIDLANATWKKHAILYSAIWLGAACWGFYTLSNTVTDLSAQHVPLRALKSAFGNMEEITKLLEQESRLTQNMPEIEALKSLFDTESNTELFKLLAEESFKEPFSMSAAYGNILVANKLMHTSARLQLRNALEAVGKIDAYLAAASLIADSNQQIRHTFVKFNKRNEPYIKFVDLTGGDQAHGKISFELSNRSKGLVIKRDQSQAQTITNAILLAHAFGIAPAREVEMSLFDGLIVHCNTQAANEPLCEDVTLCLNKLAQQRNPQTNLAIIDNLTPAENHSAHDSCVQAAQKAAQLPNTITIITTDCPHVAAAIRG
jgi:hypothetical protein